MQQPSKKSHTSGSPVLPIYGRSAMAMSVSQRVGIIAMKRLTLILALASFTSFGQVRHIVGATVNYLSTSTPNNAFLPKYTDNTGNTIATADKQPSDGVGIGVIYRLQISHFYAQAAPQYLKVGFGYKSPNNQLVKAQESANYSFGYLSVPVKVGYFILDQGFKLGIEGGIAYNQNIEANRSYTYDYLNTHISNRTKIAANSSMVSASIGLNVGFEINEKVKIELVPQYMIGLTEVASGYKVNGLSFGLNVGYYLK